MQAYAWPLGLAVLVGGIGAWLILWIYHRLKGRDRRRARIGRVLGLPMATAWPLLLLHCRPPAAGSRWATCRWCCSHPHGCSAGLIGLVAGIAAKPVFGNLIAGLQIAVTQPIRLDDVVIVEGEWGRIEEIGSSYVVVRIWDERRMVVPLTWFIENPFQNWTRRSADLLGTAFLWLDYRAPVAAIRAELERICRGEALWDGRVCVTQVTETSERAIQVRLLVSARSSGDAFDLRCLVRERMLDFLAREHPQSLPQVRARLQHEDEQDMPRAPRARTADVRSPGAEDGEAAIVPVELEPER